MPSLKEIREFNDSLVRLADEPSVIREWGEEVEPLPEPDEGLDTDLSSLLADTGELAAPEEPAEAEAAPGAEVEPLPPEFAEPFETPGPEEPEFAEPFETPGPEEPEAPEPEEPAAAEPFAPEPPSPEPGGEMDFSDFEALLSDEALETPAEDEAEVEAPEFEASEFEAPEFEASEFEPPEPEAEQPPGEEPAGDETAAEGEEAGFSMDDFDFTGAFEEEGFTFEDESEAVPAAEGPSEAPAEVPTEPPMEAPAETEIGPLELEGELGAFEFSDEDVEEEFPTSDEAFSFEAPAVPGAEEPFAAPEAPGEEEEGGEEFAEAGDLEELDTGGIDEFSLGDFGAEFGVIGDEGAASEEDLNPAISVPDIAPGAVSAGTGEFRISDSEFEILKRTLGELPLNLRKEVGEIITEAKGTTDQVEQLVRRLAAGESPSDIATLASRILGRQIRIPRGYEKRTGREFEAERAGFAYQFRENILPILRLVAVIVVAVGILAVAGYNLVYRPLYGRSLYQEGLALIAEDQYALGNERFARAREVWAADRWFSTYAEAFIDERQYLLASEKYQQLLFGMSEVERDRYNAMLANREFGSIVLEREPPKQGILDYAHLESSIIGNHERADLLLRLILYEDANDFEGLLAVGDNNMRWAETVPERYEDARIAYAKLMDRYGQTNLLLFRMLTYFVRTDNLEQVLILKDSFESNARLEVDPVRYTEMAGYLIDRDRLDGVEDVLFRAMDADPFLPQIHYHLARYYRLVGVAGSEQVALERAEQYLAQAEPKTASIRRMYIDTLTRIGENLYDAERYLDAQDKLTTAVEEYEAAVERRLLGPDPMFGRAYNELANIFYYVGRQYDVALRNYNLAEQNGYDEPNMDYKQGFVLYRNSQVESALREFREAAEDPSGTTNALLWATGNTYYRRGNHYAAEAYYRELLDRVERQRDNIRFLLVDEDPVHESVVDYLIRVNNNLGVTLSQQFESSGDPDLFSTALIYLTESIEYSENYRRDPDTLARSSAVDLAYLNQREMLYPTPEYSMQIYNELPEDLDDLVF